MSSHGEISVRNTGDGTAAVCPPETNATPSTEALQTIGIPSPGASWSPTIPAIPDQGVLDRSTIEPSTSAPVSDEEAAIPGRESPRKVISGRDPTFALIRPDPPISSQENDTPKLEGATSMGLTSAKSMTKLPPSSTVQHHTPDQHHSIEVPLNSSSLGSSAGSRAQHSTPQDAPTGRLDSSGDVPLIAPDTGPETFVPAQQNDAPGLEGFFAKYRSLVIPSRFDRFRSTLGRERAFRAFMYQDKAEVDTYQRSWESKWEPWMVKQLCVERGTSRTLLIEDADIKCILALDEEFSLDPRFVVSYASYNRFSKNVFLVPRGSALRSHRAVTGMAGSWYISCSTTAALFSWRGNRPSRQRIPKFFDRGEATNEKRPWWREDCRQTVEDNEIYCEVESKIACYCLTDDIRKLRIYHGLEICSSLTLAGRSPLGRVFSSIVFSNRTTLRSSDAVWIQSAGLGAIAARVSRASGDRSPFCSLRVFSISAYAAGSMDS